MNLEKINKIVNNLYDRRIGIEEAVLVYVRENDDINMLTKPFLELSENQLQHFIGSNILWAKAAKEYLGWQGYDRIGNIVHESLDDNIIIILPCQPRTFLVVIAKKVPFIPPGYLNLQIDETVEKLKAVLKDDEPSPTGSTQGEPASQPLSTDDTSKEYPHGWKISDTRQ